MNSRRRKYTYIRFVTYTPRGRGRVHVHSLADRAAAIPVALHLGLGGAHGRSELLALLDIAQSGTDAFVAPHQIGVVAAAGATEAAALGAGARVVAFRRRFIAPAASGKFALLKPLAR